jgi:hypothetical protein
MSPYSRRGRQRPDTHNVARGLRGDVCVAEGCLLRTCHLCAYAILSPQHAPTRLFRGLPESVWEEGRPGVAAGGGRSGAPGGVQPRWGHQKAVCIPYPLLVYLKTYALQVLQGRLFGMVQSKANRWIHILLPALLAALRALGDAPARSLTALTQRLGVADTAAATLVAPLEEAAAPEGAVPAVAPASPLLPMTGRHDASSAPTTLLNSKRVIAARKEITRSKMSCWSMPSSSSAS